MITLHLIRHGETVWHAENRYAGVTDIQLTTRGRMQAASLSAWAVTAGIDVVASSDLRRAEQTARVVAEAIGVDLRIEPDLREVDFGRAEGMTRDEMHEVFPDALEDFLAAPASSPLPGGERGSDAADRGLKAIARIAREQPGDATLAVVAHTTLIRLMLCRMLGMPLDDYRRRFPRLDNTAITTVTAPTGSTATELSDSAALVRYNAPPWA